MTASLSIIVPVYNEADNIGPLVDRIHEALADERRPWELIMVDDGSMDTTVKTLQAARKRHGEHVRIVELARNFGQTAAMQAGLDLARGDVIALMDGDLQNDPADLSSMIRMLIEDDLDAVVGWRKNRKDGLFLRKLPSQLANRLIGRVTGVRLHDYGCTLKVFRASTIKGLRLYGEMHRFIPAWIAMRTRPERIREVAVRHHPRLHGESKYGLSRTFRVLIDLVVVFFFMRYGSRPGHFFGLMGFATGGAGSLMMLYLLAIKLMGEDIGMRPMFLTGVLLIVLSVQLLTTAVMSELLSRTYFESRETPPYLIADGTNHDGSWHPGAADSQNAA